jgi:hypothetical protein
MTFRFPLDKLTQNPYDVAAWHLLLLLPKWCLALPPGEGAIRHRETRIQLKHFLASN